MSHPIDDNRGAWPVAKGAAMVGADPARRAVHTVEGPTLHDREIGFGRGLASSDRSPTCFGRSSRASARSFGPGRSSRSLRRAASSIVAVLALALLATGCGGGDEAAAVDTGVVDTGVTPTVDPATGATTVADPNASATGVTAPLTNAADDSTPGANEIANADAAIGKEVKVTATTPKKFRAAHCSKPIMVVYFQPKSVVDEKLMDQATQAAAAVGGVVTMAYTPKDVKAAGDLPAKLGLFATPGVATVGRDGTIENFWTTYVDKALIERSLLNAKNSKPCKVSSGEVPTAGGALQDAALVASGGKLQGGSTDPLAGSPPGTPAVDAAGVATGGTDPLTGQPIA